jgi:transcriptional regulator with XRE-family HTH domain
MERTESLADLVRRVRQEKKLSLNDVVRQSGGRIANSHVSRIENGFATNITTAKLRALAAGLQVSDDEVFAAAHGKAMTEAQGPEDFITLFYGWDEATAEERAAAMDAIKMIAESFQRRKIQKKELALNSSPDTPNGKDSKKRPPHPAEVERPDDGQDVPVTDTPERLNDKEGDKKEEPPRRPRAKRR